MDLRARPAGLLRDRGRRLHRGLLPGEYRDAYFFGDYAAQRVCTMRFDDQATVIREPEPNGFGVENGAPVEFEAAPNGDVVYADIAGSTLKRLVNAGG